MLFALSLALPLAAVGYSLLYLLFGGGLGVRDTYIYCGQNARGLSHTR